MGEWSVFLRENWLRLNWEYPGGLVSGERAGTSRVSESGHVQRRRRTSRFVTLAHGHSMLVMYVDIPCTIRL